MRTTRINNETREAIVKLDESGINADAISKIVKVSKTTVYTTLRINRNVKSMSPEEVRQKMREHDGTEVLSWALKRNGILIPTEVEQYQTEIVMDTDVSRKEIYEVLNAIHRDLQMLIGSLN